MFRFPHDVYVDVRIVESHNTEIRFKELVLQSQNPHREGSLDPGIRWHPLVLRFDHRSENIQASMDTLVQMATPNPDILNHPVVQAFQVNQEKMLRYEADSVTKISIEEKQALLEEILAQIADPAIVNHNSRYVDNKTIKSFFSSKGAAITFDQQTCGIRMTLDIVCGENKDQAGISKGATFFSDLGGYKQYFQDEIAKSIAFIRDAEPVVPGEYTVLLSPEATGVFTHESSGTRASPISWLEMRP